jgi:lipopolysaccharide transport system ATP-binding protein
MYVRLAFAVAAHLEPDILIVDEVLAVGDAEFQKKCLGKMEEVSAEDGRAVLFVSHNLAAVQFLCNNGIWVKDASIEEIGNVGAIIEQYTRRFCVYSKSAKAVFSSDADSGRHYSKVFKEISLMNNSAQPVTSFALNEDIFVKLTINKTLAPCDADLGVSIYKGVERISSICTWMTGDTKPIKKMSSSEILLSIKAPRLSPGLYNLTLSASDHQAGTVYEIIDSVLSFTIENLKGYQSTSEFHSEYGVICIDGNWTY